MKTHNDLDVWKNSIKLTNEIYSITKLFPKYERFGLSSQMERSAVSIASNIAEGAARGSDKEFIRFLNYSIASSSELETQMIIAKNQNYINEIDIIIEEISTIRQKLCGLIRYLKKRIN
ncbi:MAG: four helix bundle protein [Candidatus Marinimicrobia bacterium]|nr:four helix bundle protein [Candidatus Neomarinimicrobiota bacterium]